MRPRCSRSCYQSVLIGFWSWGRGVLGLVTNRFWLGFWVLRPSSSWPCYQSFFIGFRVETEVFSVLLPIIFLLGFEVEAEEFSTLLPIALDWVFELRPRSSRPCYQSLLIGFSVFELRPRSSRPCYQSLLIGFWSWGRGVLVLATNRFWLGFRVEAEEFSTLWLIALDWVFELRPRSYRPCYQSLLIGLSSWSRGVLVLATNRSWLGFGVEVEEFSCLLPITFDWVFELRPRSSQPCYQSLLIGFLRPRSSQPCYQSLLIGFLSWSREVLVFATNRSWLGFRVEVDEFSALLPISSDWVFEFCLFMLY